MIDLYDMQCNAFLPMQSIRSLLLHHSIYFLLINWIIKIGTTTTKYKYVYFKISKRQAPAGRGPGGIERRREEEERRKLVVSWRKKRVKKCNRKRDERHPWNDATSNIKTHSRPTEHESSIRGEILFVSSSKARLSTRNRGFI